MEPLTSLPDISRTGTQSLAQSQTSDKAGQTRHIECSDQNNRTMNHKKITEKYILSQGALFKKHNVEDTNYNHVFVCPPFRVFYRTDSSELSPQDLTDSNNDGVPDYILSITHKFIVAWFLLTKSFYLKEPFSHGIFKLKDAEYIDLKLKNIPVEHGLTSDRVFNEQHELLEGTVYAGKSLRIIIHNKLYSKTATPIHELFHLFQYTYTQMNNMWLMEGLGRWVQSIVKESTGKTERLPDSDKELKTLFKKWHDAEFFWNRLTDLCEQEHSFVIPEELNDSKEIINNQRSGSQFMPLFLEHCEKQTRQLLEEEHSRDISADNHWPREEKRSANNNIYILRAILNTIDDLSPPNNKELETFIQLIKPICEHHIDAYDKPDIQKLMSTLQRFELANIRINAQAILYSDYYDCYSGTLSVHDLNLSSKALNNKDLESFKCVKNIIGNLNLSDNPDLTDLTGLSNLESIEGHLLINDTGLSSVHNLSKLERIKGSLEIKNNNNLVDIIGFDNLDVIDKNLQIVKNQQLAVIDAFHQLRQIKKGPLLIENCKKLSMINGFKQLVDVQGIRLFNLSIENADFLKLFIQKNYRYKHFFKITFTQLKNTQFMQGITSIGSSFYLHNNKITSLDGLENLESVGASFSISNNQITTLQPLKKLKTISGLLGIAGNNLTTLQGLENLSTVKVTNWNGKQRSLLLNGNHDLYDISALANLKGKDGKLILYIGNLVFTKKPNKNSIFSKNNIEVLGNRRKNMTSKQLSNKDKVFKSIFDLYKQVSKNKESIVLGVNGSDCSGKSYFSRALKKYLSESGVSTTIVDIDKFNVKAVEKNIYKIFTKNELTDNQFDIYYHKIIDFQAAKNKIQELKQFYSIVIVEGIFIYKDILADAFDIKTFIDVNHKIALERYMLRRKKNKDVRPVEIFNDIWLPAHQRYINEYKPQSLSDLIIDNSDHKNPVVLTNNKTSS